MNRQAPNWIDEFCDALLPALLFLIIISLLLMFGCGKAPAPAASPRLPMPMAASAIHYPPNWVPKPPNTNTNMYVSFVATSSAIVGMRYGILFATNIADVRAGRWRLWPQSWPADGSTAMIKVTGFREFYVRDEATNLFPK